MPTMAKIISHLRYANEAEEVRSTHRFFPTRASSASQICRPNHRVVHRGRPAEEVAMKVELTRAPVAETAMLIRKPIADVFEAFIDPDVTTNFWFTKSSGRLKVSLGHL